MHAREFAPAEDTLSCCTDIQSSAPASIMKSHRRHVKLAYRSVSGGSCWSSEGEHQRQCGQGRHLASSAGDRALVSELGVCSTRGK